MSEPLKAKDSFTAMATKKKRRWEKSIEDGETSKKISVREIANGFIITYSRSGRDEGEYAYREVEMFSKTNPLADADPMEEEEKKLSKEFDGLFETPMMEI